MRLIALYVCLGLSLSAQVYYDSGNATKLKGKPLTGTPTSGQGWCLDSSLGFYSPCDVSGGGGSAVAHATCTITAGTATCTATHNAGLSTPSAVITGCKTVSGGKYVDVLPSDYGATFSANAVTFNLSSNAAANVICVANPGRGETGATGATGAAGTGGADASGYYLVNRSTNAPANGVNLGALTSGIVSLSVSAGVATPSTVANTATSGQVYVHDGAGGFQGMNKTGTGTLIMTAAVAPTANAIQVGSATGNNSTNSGCSISSSVLTCGLASSTGLPISTGVSGLGTGVATALATPSSANFISALTDETGTGLLVFNSSPTIVTPTIASFVNATHTHQNSAGGGTLDAAAIAAGTVATARLGSGTANSSSFLRGDNTWDATVTKTIASGTAALGTSAIASGACATVVTATATGGATTDILAFTPNADITAVTGYAPVTTGGLAIYPYVTANTANFKVCNPTSSSITPGAVSLNWRIVR